jgi:hypothetical protein
MCQRWKRAVVAARTRCCGVTKRLLAWGLGKDYEAGIEDWGQ